MGFVRNLTGDHPADKSYITRHFLEERWVSLKKTCETCNEHVTCGDSPRARPRCPHIAHIRFAALRLRDRSSSAALTSAASRGPKR